jgi:hypothetical protein
VFKIIISVASTKLNKNLLQIPSFDVGGNTRERKTTLGCFRMDLNITMNQKVNLFSEGYPVDTNMLDVDTVLQYKNRQYVRI